VGVFRVAGRRAEHHFAGNGGEHTESSPLVSVPSSRMSFVVSVFHSVMQKRMYADVHFLAVVRHAASRLVAWQRGAKAHHLSALMGSRPLAGGSGPGRGCCRVPGGWVASAELTVQPLIQFRLEQDYKSGSVQPMQGRR
jgi:hypothetical protein